MHGSSSRWFKPNFWTLAYLEKAGAEHGESSPVTCGGCVDVLIAFVAIGFAFWLLVKILSIFF
jgi:hypothetical protein